MTRNPLVRPEEVSQATKDWDVEYLQHFERTMVPQQNILAEVKLEKVWLPSNCLDIKIVDVPNGEKE